MQHISRKRTISVAMLGARRHYAVPRLLHEAGLLERFYTDSYVGNKPLLRMALEAIPTAIQPAGVKRWLGRQDAAIPPHKVTSFETLGIWYARARALAKDQQEVSTIYVEAGKRFAEKIIKKGFGSSIILWGFNTASVELFHEAKKQDILCVLEQTILPKLLERKLLLEETTRWPDWEPGLKQHLQATSPMIVREEQEWSLADLIVAGSEFVKDGLIECGVAAEKIRVIPYGVDTEQFPNQTESKLQRKGPLRLLFAGHVGLRKGVPDVLHAVYQLPSDQVHLRLAGGISLNRTKLSTFTKPNIEFLGHVPRVKMRELFQWADVFVLPSIVEGSATVTYEALMSGLPVICTPNTGSIVQDNICGYIIPVHDQTGLTDAITSYINDRNLLAQHKAAASQACHLASTKRYKNDLERAIVAMQ